MSQHRACLHTRVCVSSSFCSPWLEPEVEISQEGSIYTTEIGECYKSSFPFPSGRRLLNIYQFTGCPGFCHREWKQAVLSATIIPVERQGLQAGTDGRGDTLLVAGDRKL